MLALISWVVFLWLRVSPNSEGNGRNNLVSSPPPGRRVFASAKEIFFSSSAGINGKGGQFLIFLGLLAAVLACYLPVLPGNFLMDDHRLVSSDNPLVTGEETPGSIWFKYDFPLSLIGWWAQWHLWGENPAGYHAVNIFLHAASAWLLWRLLVRLKIPGALLAALVFAVHPVCVNSVARMAELKNTLSLPFFLLSFLAWLHYEERALHPPAPAVAKPAPATGWYALALLAFVGALFSKTSTIMLPVILLGHAVWRRGRIARTDWLHLAPFFLLSLGFGLLSMWYQKNQALVGQSLPPANFAERLAMAGWNFWFYLGKALFPANLSVMYFRWKPDMAHWSAWLPDLALLAAFAACWFFRRQPWARNLQFGLGCFLVALFPALGLMDAQYLVKFQVSDHLQYLPLMVPLVLAAAFLAQAAGRKIFLLAGGIWVLLLAGLAFQRAQVFSTQEGLMRDTLKKNSAAWAAHNDLGVILAGRKNYAGAETEFTASLAANPENDEARLNLAQLLIVQGQFEDARRHLELALRHNPADSAIHEKLGEVLAHLGRPQAAVAELKAAVSLDNKPHTNSRMALAGLLYATGNYREAVQEYRRILSAKPDLTEPLNNLAWILATCPDAGLRDGVKGVEYAEYACLITKFKDPHMAGTLAAAYAEAGRFPEAVVTADFAANLAAAAQDWQLAEISRQLGRVYRSGRPWHETPPAGAAGQ